GAPVSIDTELGAHMREFESMVRRDTDEIYTRLDDEQGQRQLLAEAGCLERLGDERWMLAILLMERRQRAISDLLETDRRRREEMRELRAADRTRQ
ncbi:hypothetical protein Tco_0051004, partial [Tanacetum coccineum]